MERISEKKIRKEIRGCLKSQPLFSLTDEKRREKMYFQKKEKKWLLLNSHFGNIVSNIEQPPFNFHLINSPQ